MEKFSIVIRAYSPPNAVATWPLSLACSLIEFNRIGLCILQQRKDIY
jgi:hypothetical protein